MELQGNWIALDASCPSTQVGVFVDGLLVAERKVETPAMESLLGSVQQLCQQRSLPLEQIRGYIYCTGPGSILGIRLSVMAIKTWSTLHDLASTQILTYSSLAIAAEQLKQESPRPDFIVCSEWRKDHWNVLPCLSNSLPHQIEVWQTPQVAAFQGEKHLLKQRKLWSGNEISFTPTEYSLRTLEDPSTRSTLLRPLNNWEIYTPDEKQYATWSGDRHRG